MSVRVNAHTRYKGVGFLYSIAMALPSLRFAMKMRPHLSFLCVEIEKFNKQRRKYEKDFDDFGGNDKFGSELCIANT